jgi:hypothetical protein
MTRIDATTVNICGNPIRSRRVVRRRMRRALSQAGVTFGQECAGSNRFRVGRRGNYADAWRNIAGRYGKTTFGHPREVPISVPAAYRVLAAEIEKAHGGKRFVSPDRYIDEVWAKVDDERVAFVNCHPPSKPRWGVPFARWRIKHWNLYINRLTAIVAELHAAGYTVVFGGDMNKRKRRIPIIHSRQRVLVSSGLDHLWVVPAKGVTVSNIRTRKIRRTLLMDHPILTASFELSRSAA